MRIIKNLKKRFFVWLWKQINLACRDMWCQPATKADIELTPLIKKIIEGGDTQCQN